MKCPFCNAEDLKVIDSRPSESNTIRRRRECSVCSERFTTYEKVEEIPIIVVKRDNTREAFNRDKIIRGIIRSCEKRPVSSSEIEEMAQRIERNLSNQMKKEIQSTVIGAMVMDELKELDEVSYVRFASVYKSFKDIDTFVSELKKMLSEKNK